MLLMSSSGGILPQTLVPSVPRAIKPAESHGASQKSTRISHACQMCKIRKTKCDGKTPCWRCQTRQTDCNYDSTDRRRARSLLLKDFNTIRDKINSYDKLMELIRSSDEEGAQHILGLIRSHSFPSIKDLVQEIEEYAAVSSDSPSISDDTAITESESEGKSPGSVANLPANERIFRGSGSRKIRGSEATSQSNSEIDMPSFLTSPVTVASEELLFGSNLSSPQYSSDPAFLKFPFRPHPTLSKVPGTNGMDIIQVSFKSACVTPFRSFNVLAKPWTSAISDNVFTSHLISLSTAWTQCLHSFLDLDSFIEDATSCKLESKFCSPLIFNSMLAIGSLFCIHKDAFVDSLEPMSRGENFIAEAKKLLSQHRPTTSLSMENLTRLQAIPLIALFEASRMRTTAAWYYTIWFFNVCLELGLPDTGIYNPRSYTPERWRLGQIAVSYALFLTDRLWLTYTTYVDKLILSGSPPYSMEALSPGSSTANRRAIIGPGSVPLKMFSDEPTPSINPSLPINPLLLYNSTVTPPAFNSHRGSYQPNRRPSILRMDMSTQENIGGKSVGNHLDLGDLIKKLQGLITTDWNDGVMGELLALHEKLQTWMNAANGSDNLTSGGSGATGGDRQSSLSNLLGMATGYVDPGILNHQ